LLLLLVKKALRHHAALLNSILKRAGMNNERTKECDTQFIVEEGESGFGAARAGFARLRCSSGDKQGVLKLTQEAIEFHLEGLR